MFKINQVLSLGFVIMLIALSPVIFSVDVLANEDNDYKNLEVLTDVLSLVRGSYVEEVDMDTLIYGAIRGMLDTLDPHSSFLTPEMYEAMQAETHGEFGGLGIEITVREGELIIVSPIEDTPAYAAGIKAGDTIIKIDGKATRDMEIMEAVRMMRGSKGEAITITVSRDGVVDPQDFTIVRDIIQIQSVKSDFLKDSYGYVRVLQFQDRTGNDLKDHLLALHQNYGEKLQGVILDLRNNPGGLLDQAVAVSNLFLKEGLIVYTEGRDSEVQMSFSAQEDGTEPDYPLIVLINGGSASAAEIVAGALQDHGRAIILGTQSFGKGSVQTIIPLDDMSGLRLTTSRYFTPLGRSIQVRGIRPDIIVPSLTTAHLDGTNMSIREQDLENHFQPTLENEVDMPRTQPEEEIEEKSGLSKDSLDNQLLRAIDHLKGINIINKNRSVS